MRYPGGHLASLNIEAIFARLNERGEKAELRKANLARKSANLFRALITSLIRHQSSSVIYSLIMHRIHIFANVFI